MSFSKSKIIYTNTDEAPMLATHSLLPIVKAFLSKANIALEVKDISLAARILAVFPEYLNDDQRVADALFELGKLVKLSEANIIKLPNISASVPQLIAAIKELHLKGFKIPHYPFTPKNSLEKEIKSRYDRVKGSAVNPVLREGNSDRRAPQSVKNYAKMNPHLMGEWSSKSRTHVATMDEGDFFHNEQSFCINENTELRIELHNNEGVVSVLKDSIPILSNEIIDASKMSKKSLLKFLEKEIADAKSSDILLSLHMKATMMKVSDPIIFSHVVRVYFKILIQKNQHILNELGVDFKNGFGDLLSKIKNLSAEVKKDIEDDIKLAFSNNARLAMVDSDKGITNLHVPSDVIIDASMPAMIRNSGKMWNKFNKTEDTKAIIPDSTYANIYRATIDFCKQYGAFDPSKMGTVSNVGLMAKKAEEYGSHDKTFEITTPGFVRVLDSFGNILLEHVVEEGDIWRMCQTKDEAIKDWVKLAVNRAKATGWPTVFWLDEKRSHDNELILKIKEYLRFYEIDDLDLKILAPYDACKYTLDRLRKGKNTVSVTGNVLRDYLTDLFPILELGTSAKMLSIVPLMQGGGLFETGAGGSAPKHVQQFVEEGHLRWDSLGEFLALVVSLEHVFEVDNNLKAKIFANALDLAIEKLLNNDKSPKRKVGQLDNRGSHFYLAMYWAEELAKQSEDIQIQNLFSALYNELKNNESKIILELTSAQGNTENIQGYYYPDNDAVSRAMRPSTIFNGLINKF